MTSLSAETTHLLHDLLRHADAEDSRHSARVVQQLLFHGTTPPPYPAPQPMRWWLNAITVMEHAQHAEHPPTAAEGATSQMLCWIRNQRREQLDPLKVMFLDTVPGWDWEPHKTRWDERAEQLAAFVAQHGRRPSTHAISVHERSLANWMQYQCARLRAKPYPADRARRLRAIPHIVPATYGA